MSFFNEKTKASLITGAAAMNLTLGKEQVNQFERYLALVEERNAQVNLTRIVGAAAIPLHLLDSLSVLAKADLAPGAKVIDIGSGAGFPGIPLKIARPDLEVVLLDATQKRVNFLAEAIEALQLSGVSALQGRAEELSHDPQYREKFNLAVCRALATLEIASELCLPYVKPGGNFIALKSAELESEVAAAGKRISDLGGGATKIIALNLPQTEITRKLAIVPKIAKTPSNYPRSNARIRRDASPGPGRTLAEE